MIPTNEPTNHPASGSTTDPTMIQLSDPTSNSINKAALSPTETAQCYRLNQFIISTTHKNIQYTK